ncbi:unnamed protein product, partial [Prorocentrum cordatum]
MPPKPKAPLTGREQVLQNRADFDHARFQILLNENRVFRQQVQRTAHNMIRQAGRLLRGVVVAKAAEKTAAKTAAKAKAMRWLAQATKAKAAAKAYPI